MMKKAFFAACVVPVLLLFSCTAVPPHIPPEEVTPEKVTPPPAEAPPEKAPDTPAVPETVTITPPEKVTDTPPERPRPPELIMGNGRSTRENLAAFLLVYNPAAGGGFVHSLSGYYIEEAAAEGVNHDVAFAQMCLETGYLRYGGLVIPEMNNFCGLGAIGPEQPGLAFPDARTGVRAHIQHLKAYASEEPLNGVLVDPRYRYVKQGSSPGIYGLAGTWAADKAYGEKIARILNRLYDFLY